MEFEICTSIYSTTLEELDIRLKQAFNYGSNLVEVRIDYLHSFEIDKLKSILSSYMDKCILTCRPISEGGKYNKSEKDRINLLYSLYELQPKFLDIELSLINKNLKFLNKLTTNNTTLIISSHNFEETPSIPELEKIVNSIGQIDYNEQHINFFNKKKLYDFLSKKKFDQINIETFIYFSPFLAILSWKLSSFIAKLEQLFSKTPFGFLLCATFIKKK